MVMGHSGYQYSGWIYLFHMGQVTKKQKWLEHLQRKQGVVLAIIAGLILLAVCYCNKAMKLVTFVQIIIYKEPMDKLTSYPYLNSFGIWWLIYTFAGVGLPWFIDYYFHKIKSYVSNPLG